MNAFQIKLLMAFLMLLDHMHYIDGFLPPEAVSIFNIVSRCVAPMFAFLAVEGIRHTRDLKKYCLRLSVLAGVMFVGNAVLNGIFQACSGALPEEKRMLLHTDNNVIFTLALGVVTIALIQQGSKRGKYLYVISGILFILGFLWGEWGSVIMPFMLVEYFFCDRRVLRYLGYVLIEAVALLLPFGEPFYFLVFPFRMLYNGKRGPETGFCKYFFYVFYPVHLWLIAVINFLVAL